MKKQHNEYLQIGYFFFIICAMSFIISALCSDLMTTMYVYFSKLKSVNTTNKNTLTSDDNQYETVRSHVENQLDTIEETIMTQHTKQKDFMKDVLDWKEKHNIPNQKLESKIDLNVLEDRHDNYTYKKVNNGESFWKLILMPPKYHELVQHNAKPFYKFKDE